MTDALRNSIAFVTGASGGIGQALIAALAARGTVRIYAAARDPSRLPAFPQVVPVRMDVRSDADVDKAASAATDTTLLINNAGVNCNTSFLNAADLDVAREEIEVNYLSVLRVTRRFAPILKSNRGALINVLAAAARVNLPFMGSYCASKAAALSLTQGVRAELAAHGVRVIAALPGAVDTRLTAALTIPKMSPAETAAGILDGFEAGEEDIYVGEMARNLAKDLAADPKAVERQMAAWL
jgi:NAD(P)-dependent dehydrogenase (short-subunit alcohol dehydrogenase family)